MPAPAWDLAEFARCAPPDVLAEFDILLKSIAHLRPHPGPQTTLIESDADEILYGGARGGGKSFGFLLHWLHHEQRYKSHAKGILLRRTYPALEDIIEESQSVFSSTGAVYAPGRTAWRFPSGALLRFRHLDKPWDAEKYQGHQMTWVAVEEAGTYPDSFAIDLMRGCLRSAHGVKCQLLLNANPGGVGHNWLKSRYVDAAPPNTPQRIIREIDLPDGSMIEVPWTIVYIPAKLTDNPSLMLADPGYAARVLDAAGGQEWLAKAWLDGDWNIVAGGMYDMVNPKDYTIPPFLVPQGWPVFRSFDYGASHPFSVGWWTRANGENHLGRHVPPGSMIRIAEWYGADKKCGRANVGLNLTVRQIALGILDRERVFGYKVLPGPADPSIFSRDPNGSSIAETLAAEGVVFNPAPMVPRVDGWKRIRDMLVSAALPRPEEPILLVVNTCRDWLRTVPALPRSPHWLDDADTEAEDHAADETRYAVTGAMHRVVTQSFAL